MMEPSVDLREVNPWAAESIYDYQYFCCPECDTKWQVKQNFVSHALEHHPTSIFALQHIKDGSIDDVEFPMESHKIRNEKLEDINNRNYLEETLKLESDINSDYDPSPSENETYSDSQYTKNHGTVTNEKEVFKSKDQMNLHMKKRHKTLPKRSAPFLCGLCGKTLIGHHNMRRHERDKHGIQNLKFRRVDRTVRIQCLKCDKNFDNVEILNNHIIECLGEQKDFQCQNCDKTWANGHALNIHMKADHDAKELYTCEICGKCCTFKNALKTHVKLVHDNIKDHVCHLCGTGFARAQGLKFHIQRVHEHSGRYACEYCDFKTVAQMKLDIHVNEVHTKAIKFACDQCNFFCYRKGGLLAHVKTVHLKLKPHECPNCPEAFVRRKELEKHRLTAGH